MTDLREYTAMKYMADCKCGKCQLVPRSVLDEQIAIHDALVKALTGLIEAVGGEP